MQFGVGCTIPTCYDLVCLLLFCMLAVFVLVAAVDGAVVVAVVVDVYLPLCHFPLKRMVQVLMQVRFSYLVLSNE